MASRINIYDVDPNSCSKGQLVEMVGKLIRYARLNGISSDSLKSSIHGSMNCSSEETTVIDHVIDSVYSEQIVMEDDYRSLLNESFARLAKATFKAILLEIKAKQQDNKYKGPDGKDYATSDELHDAESFYKKPTLRCRKMF